MRTPQLLAIEPEFIKDVMIKSFKNFHDNDLVGIIDKDTDPIFGRNPFMLAGNEWKEKRAEITPAFTPSRVSNFFIILLSFLSILLFFLYIDKSSFSNN